MIRLGIVGGFPSEDRLAGLYRLDIIDWIVWIVWIVSSVSYRLDCIVYIVSAGSYQYWSWVH